MHLKRQFFLSHHVEPSETSKAETPGGQLIVCAAQDLKMAKISDDLKVVLLNDL